MFKSKKAAPSGHKNYQKLLTDSQSYWHILSNWGLLWSIGAHM